MSVHFSILLIEPPGIDSQLINLMLAPENFHVSSAECGTEAWNLIQESDPPDLVVIDIDLPVSGQIRIGGNQLLQLLGKKSGWRDVPKMILTSSQNSSIPKQLPVSQIEAIILKPYDPRRFMDEIYGSLSKHLDSHIQEINRQHIHLASLIQELATLSSKASDRYTIHQKLKEFLEFTSHHFAFEENFMYQHNYPDFAIHHQNHNQLLTETNTLVSEIVSGSQPIHPKTVGLLKRDFFDDVSDDERYITFLKKVRTDLMR